MVDSDLTPEQMQDLTDEAIKDTQKVQRLADAASWAQSMQRTFKGIRGAPNRRQRVSIAIQMFRLNEDD